MPGRGFEGFLFCVVKRTYNARLPQGRAYLSLVSEFKPRRSGQSQPLQHL